MLIPAMENVFATKKNLERFAGQQDLDMVRKDLTDLKEKFFEYKDTSIYNQDKILKGIETIMMEEKIAYY